MMNIGEKGKHYGLIKPATLKKVAVFAQDDDDEHDVNAQLRQVSSKKQKQAAAEQAKIQQEDPTVYDYDGVYEKMQATKQQAAPSKQPARQSKYIGALMEKAKIREREWGIAYDVKLQKERKHEDDTFAGKEKFVTSAYKKKLQEDQMWKAEEARRAALEEDVTKKSDLGSFYKNLLDGNEAYGGIKETKPQEKKSTKEDRKDKDDRRGRDSSERDSGDKKDSDSKKDRDSSERDSGDRKDRDSEKDRDSGDRKDMNEDDKKDTDREDRKRTRDDEAGENGKDAKKENGDAKKEGEDNNKAKEENKEESKKGDNKETASAPPPQKVKKLDEDAVSAARLRYLQRKGLA